MSDYTKITDFTAKDAAEAIIEGADFDSEFNAIATASASKTDKAVPATANSVAGLDSAGNLYDTTHLVSDMSDAITNSPATGFMALWPTDTPPSGWVLCDGTSYSTASQPDLFAVVGYTYGGSGANFNVPDLRGRMPLGQDDMGGTSANRVTATAADSLGGSGGAETHTLTESEIPSHTHTGSASTDGNHRHSLSTSNVEGGSGDPGLAEYTTHDRYSSYAGDHTHTITIGSTGGGSAHENMTPYLTVNYIIKT